MCGHGSSLVLAAACVPPFTALVLSPSAPFDKTANITFSLNADDENVSTPPSSGGGGGCGQCNPSHLPAPTPCSPTPTCSRSATRTGSSNSMMTRRRRMARVLASLTGRMAPGRAAHWPGDPAWVCPQACGESPPTSFPRLLITGSVGPT